MVGGGGGCCWSHEDANAEGGSCWSPGAANGAGGGCTRGWSPDISGAERVGGGFAGGTQCFPFC